MGEKDITEKQLFELEDVFADIVNVLLLDGKNVILPEELIPANKDSIYKDKNLKIHMQERDVAKLWIKGNVRLAFFGLENQTAIDYNMPLRIIAYDGAVYRAMLDEKNKSNFTLYPAITIILHFDYEHHWTGPRSLKECFKDIPNGLQSFVSDYKINVFEIAWLPDETVSKFQSDFKYLADYYCQMRKNQKWQPMPGNAKHIKQLLDLFSVVTKDTRFIDMYHHAKGEMNDMSCVALDYLAEEYTNKGIKQGIKQGVIQGVDSERLNSIKNLIKNLKFTAIQAMDALSIPQKDRKRYLDKL